MFFSGYICRYNDDKFMHSARWTPDMFRRLSFLTREETFTEEPFFGQYIPTT